MAASYSNGTYATTTYVPAVKAASGDTAATRTHLAAGPAVRATVAATTAGS